MINAGIDLKAVGKTLGHASHGSTARYSDVANDRPIVGHEAGRWLADPRPAQEQPGAQANVAPAKRRSRSRSPRRFALPRYVARPWRPDLC